MLHAELEICSDLQMICKYEIEHGNEVIRIDAPNVRTELFLLNV